MRTREHLIWAAAAVAIAGLLGGLTHAGSLTPAGAPAPTMTNLDDIGQLAAATAGFVPATVPDEFRGPAYAQLRISGTDVQGEDTVLGVSDVIQVFGFEAGVVATFDAASGLPTGQRQYEPIVFRKRVDKASPKIMEALTAGQIVDLAVFRFHRPSPAAGQEEVYYTITLTNARVVSINHSTGASTDSSEPVTEQIGFVFEKIIWTHEIGGVEHTDDWSQPPV